MIRSMTGYGRATFVFDDAEYTVEIKAVNNRHLDISMRLPRSLNVLEDRLKKHISACVSRGKVDVFCGIQTLATSRAQIELDEPLTEQYLKALYTLRDKYGLLDDISVSAVAKNSELFLHRMPEEDAEKAWESLRTVADEALLSFTAMREREGAALAADFRGKLARIAALVAIIEEKAPETVVQYQDRLNTKLEELCGAQFDKDRLLTEVALLADRVAIDEEITRLKSHLSQFDGALNDTQPVGRKLDFLTQEINREVNTIGSKCARLEITDTVIALKNELEKIREQIQNVE